MSTSRFRVGHLPSLNLVEVTWQTLQLGTQQQPLAVDVPCLTPTQMATLTQCVRQASAKLKQQPLANIIRVIDTVVARLLDESDPYRQQLEDLLPRATGFSAEMVRLHLHSYLRTFRALQLHRFVTEDFGNPLLLDEFQPRVTGGWSHAEGPELIVHVWAGNIPALPLWSLVSGLLVKAGNVGKVASAEPVFATVFAHVWAEVAPEWADCLAVVWWQGGDVAQEACAFKPADVVVAYGGNAALQALRQHVPITTRFLPHGHKLSFGMVSCAALSVRKGAQVAAQAALDVVRFEQQGCYSPHLFYVQRGGKVTPHEFAQKLAAELSALAPKFPPRALSLEESVSLSAWRESHAWQQIQGEPIHVLGDTATPWFVVYFDHPLPLSPGPLNRCVQVVAVDHLTQVPALITEQRSYLQTVGLAAAPEELLSLGQSLANVGVTRICAIGAMTGPAAGWHHDGRFNLLDLVNMVDIEASTEITAEHFTAYEP